MFSNFKAKTVKLNDGRQMPILGFGTSQRPDARGVEKLQDALKVAVGSGVRHVDCASAYENENVIGETLKALFSEGKVKREDMWITSKLWNTSHSAEAASKAVAQSLESLGLDYLDLYLVHWPMSFREGGELFPSDSLDGTIVCWDIDYVDTYKTLEQFLRKGWCKSIGVSNFNSAQIRRLVQQCDIVPAVNQVECHPYLNQEDLRKVCAEYDIQLIAYAPLGSPASKYHNENTELVLQNETIRNIAFAHGKSAAQVCLRFQIQRGIAVIPKAASEKHARENADIWDFELSTEEMEALMKLGARKTRYFTFPQAKHSQFYPFAIDF